MVFALLVLTVVAAFHLYLWQRLVRDTTRPGRARRTGGRIMAGVAVLVLGTLIGTRYVDPAVAKWFAWPGYLSFALVFYLVVVLAVLELVLLSSQHAVVVQEVGVGRGERQRLLV